jgi:hypothetical protein
MSDKQNPGLNQGNSLPAEDEQPFDQNESSPKSYYYDDATGYEIYKEENDEDEQEEESR